MGFWQQVDALLRRHATRQARLVELCREARWLKPRFVAPCVWVLREPKGERLSFHSFEAAVEAITPHAQKRRRALEAKAEAKRAKALARAQRAASRKDTEKRKG